MCRSAALHLSASCQFRMNASAPSSTVETICRPSVHYFATLRTSFQRPTYPPSGAPSSPSLAPLRSPYPQKAPQTSPSVVDAPPPHVLRIPQTISSVCARSPLCSRKLSWQARRRTIGCVLYYCCNGRVTVVVVRLPAAMHKPHTYIATTGTKTRAWSTPAVVSLRLKSVRKLGGNSSQLTARKTHSQVHAFGGCPRQFSGLSDYSGIYPGTGYARVGADPRKNIPGVPCGAVGESRPYHSVLTKVRYAGSNPPECILVHTDFSCAKK